MSQNNYRAAEGMLRVFQKRRYLDHFYQSSGILSFFSANHQFFS